MISDQEFLYGAAFLRLINNVYQITITHLSSIHSSLYLVETDSKKSAILFKVSKKPKSSWSFTLSNKEGLAFNDVHLQYPKASIFIALICHKDGVCCIPEEKLWNVLEKPIDSNGQHISVSRKINSSYYVSGPGRQKIEQAIPQSNWPRIVLSD
ncbi:hypothetical protein QM565_15200 [Geitlerinema splendidum]|nr:hypothetical protein [Geitlerinema splendidum]